jgi:hypothetical protein
MTGDYLISKERHEHFTKHHIMVQDDVLKNPNGELITGAKALIDNLNVFPKNWDPKICKHMLDKTKRERLVTAGALIAAEIDRLLEIGEGDI